MGMYPASDYTLGQLMNNLQNHVEPVLLTTCLNLHDIVSVLITLTYLIVSIPMRSIRETVRWQNLARVDK